ncbi:Tn3 family transposase [Streptomyces sp. NPDC050121]|uniref:Tn3 family transposase n=1 Tax=Streptomyces sp. NPDC050121 TaxID=3365601 RepID=UPI00379AC9F6
MLRQRTDMEVDRRYTDTGGASIVGFALAHMLDFKLMSRLKNTGSAKLYRPARRRRADSRGRCPVSRRSC